jgi:hypothetical protein
MLAGGACAFAPRNEKHKTRRIIVLFIADLLDRKVEGVFTAPYISYAGKSVKHAAETTMKQDDKTGTVTATIQEIAYYNMFLTEAIFELMAEKGILTGEEVKERIKKLKSETPLQFRWQQ